MPVDVMTLATFLPVALALNLTPGPDMMLSVGAGLAGGWRRALAASAGISVGVMIHAGAAGLGLAALVAAQPWALTAIRWAGAAYLAWLAVAMLRGPAATAGGARPVGPAFRAGLLANLANVKVIVFTLALLPQFAEPERGAMAAQFLTLGAVLAAGGFMANALAGAMAGRLGALAGRHARVLNVAAAGILGALALRLAAMERG